MTFPLFSLPLEIRQRIYEHILSMPTQDPPLDPSPPDPKAERVLINYARRLEPTFNAPVTCGSLLYTCSGLLLACRQTCTEVLEVIRLLCNGPPSTGEGPLPYVLDMMVPSPVHLVTTWLSMPAPPTELAAARANGNTNEPEQLGVNVVAHFRILEATQKSVRWVGNGGPGAVASNLLHVIGHWCENGILFSERCAAFPMHSTDVSKRLVTDILTVLFVPWDETEPVTAADIIANHGQGDWRLNWWGRDPTQYSHYSCLTAELHRIVKSGLLAGYMRTVRVGVRGRDIEHEWEVETVDEGTRRATSSEWADYGWVPGRKD